MSVLLAAIPYLVTIAIYCVTVQRLFHSGRKAPPASWSSILASPIAIGGLAPLSLASRRALGSECRGLLLLAAAGAIVFVVLVLTLLQGEERYWWLERTVRVGRLDATRLRWRHLLMLSGVAVLGYGAIVNVIASSA